MDGSLPSVTLTHPILCWRVLLSCTNSCKVKTITFFSIFPFNQCPTLFASARLTCHHLGKGFKDLLWMKSRCCTGAWQPSENFNDSFNNTVDGTLWGGDWVRNQCLQIFKYRNMYILRCSWGAERCQSLKALGPSAFVQKDVLSNRTEELADRRTAHARQEGQTRGTIQRWHLAEEHCPLTKVNLAGTHKGQCV